MKTKKVKRILAAVLSLVMVLGMGLTSFAAPKDEDYSRASLNAEEKAAIKTIFDAQWYKEENPDVVACVGDSEDALFTHFLTHGMWETRQPSKDFNVNAYYAAYKDLQENLKGLSEAELVKALFLHYATMGKNEEKREATTIQKALERTGEIKYIGSFHSDEIPGTQEGAVVAKSAGINGKLMGPRVLALLNTFVGEIRAFASNPDNHLGNILTGEMLSSDDYDFPGFETFDEMTNVAEILSAEYLLGRDIKRATIFYGPDGYEEYARVTGEEETVIHDEAEALYEIVKTFENGLGECYEDLGFDLTALADDHERFLEAILESTDSAYSDWNSYLAKNIELELQIAQHPELVNPEEALLILAEEYPGVLFLVKSYTFFDMTFSF